MKMDAGGGEGGMAWHGRSRKKGRRVIKKVKKGGVGCRKGGGEVTG